MRNRSILLCVMLAACSSRESKRARDSAVRRADSVNAAFDSSAVARAWRDSVGASLRGSRPYGAGEVTKAADIKPPNPSPKYPESLRHAEMDGDVIAQFVVDTTGRVDMSTFRVEQSSHRLFSDAVEHVLPQWRFYPAEINGRKVRQLVRQPFTFQVNH